MIDLGKSKVVQGMSRVGLQVTCPLLASCQGSFIILIGKPHCVLYNHNMVAWLKYPNIPNITPIYPNI